MHNTSVENLPLRTLQQSSGDNSNNLVTPIFRRLQNTLIRGIFGDAHSECFQETFEMPKEAILPERETVEGGGAEEGDNIEEKKFMKQLWEMVGWDVLQLEMSRLNLGTDTE